MDEKDKIENPAILKFATELLDDVQVSIMNIRDKAMLVSTIRTKWVMMMFKEREMVKKLSNARKKLLETGVVNLQTTDTANRTISKMRLEEMVIASDPKIKKIDRMIVEQQEVIQFIEYAMNIVSDFNFTVKHALDAIKLEQS